MIVASSEIEVALDYVQRAGVLGMLIGITLGAVRRWWFPRWYVLELEDDRDQWKAIALKGTELAERQMPLVEEAVARGRRVRR